MHSGWNMLIGQISHRIFQKAKCNPCRGIFTHGFGSLTSAEWSGAVQLVPVLQEHGSAGCSASRAFVTRRLHSSVTSFLPIYCHILQSLRAEPTPFSVQAMNCCHIFISPLVIPSIQWHFCHICFYSDLQKGDGKEGERTFSILMLNMLEHFAMATEKEEWEENKR